MQYFWQKKTLSEMSHAEWESLCDGCARCCLLKLEDEDTGSVHFTNVSCRLLDTATCRCKDYSNRTARVPGCLSLTPENLRLNLNILPSTCAYKRLYLKQDLPDWHPLMSGQRSTVHATASVRGLCLSEDHVHPDQLQQHIVTWPRQ